MKIADIIHAARATRSTRIAAALTSCALAYLLTRTVGGVAQEWLESASGPLAAALLERVDVGRSAPGQVAETIAMTGSLALAAVAPALASGAFTTRWRRAAIVAAALYPAWIAVMFAPASIVYGQSLILDPSHQAAQLFGGFLMSLSASAAAVTLAYALWARGRTERRTGDLVGDVLLGRTRKPVAAQTVVYKPAPVLAEAA